MSAIEYCPISLSINSYQLPTKSDSDTTALKSSAP